MTPDSASRLWTDFRARFIEELQNRATAVFESAWRHPGARTQFYDTDLLPAVASRLGLSVERELLTIDVVMCRRSHGGVSVPLIFIESENNTPAATREVHHLCCVAAPVKVLMTCWEWDETPGAWKSGGRRTRSLSEWERILRAHGEIWPQETVFGVIVAEWHDGLRRLRFYGIAYDGGANRIEDGLWFERRMDELSLPVSPGAQ